MTKNKVIFIGLDGADKDLIFEWANTGLLPTFQSLLQKGTFGITQDPPGINGSHWPSFLSGISPTSHGRYWTQQLQPSTYEIKPSSFKKEPFWNTLSQAGRKIALIDAPEAPFAEGINGIQIIESLNRNLQGLTFRTYPPSLATEITSKLGNSCIGSPRFTGRDLGNIKSFCDDLKTSVDNKLELISHFLKEDQWDLLLTSFRESHWIGHQCWHLHDPNHPEYDAKIVKAIGDPIKDIYIEIDTAIGKLLEQVSPETIVLILASTGMGPNYSGVHLLDEILLRLENPQRPAQQQEIKQTLNFLKQFKFLRQIKKSLLKSTPNPQGKSKQAFDKSHRQCFQVPSSEAYGGIRLNLVGREPQGRIQPGQEYESFCQAIIQDLLDIVNDNTGEPVIRQVFRSKDLYHGEQPNGHPDLLVEWNRNAPITAVYSPKIGKVEKIYWDSRTGDHKSGGLFIALGDSLKPMLVEDITSIIDFAPTIASLLQVELPDTDGKVIAAICAS